MFNWCIAYYYKYTLTLLYEINEKNEYVYISNLERTYLNLHYTDEDQKSETIAYSYQEIEKKIIWYRKKKPSTHITGSSLC